MYVITIKNLVENPRDDLLDSIRNSITNWDFHFSNPELEKYLSSICKWSPSSYGEVMSYASYEELKIIQNLLNNK